ncbi:filamentous hemagglutinin N-terminal domain-containing protein [Variovorax guangxiensis]|uniref:two-partner secretion domain-containing protein n=1 Tax=Variovorax guangxiensis TaxID=1775474 RepID=UPI00285CF81E|nr:filamentous hemagglutinin N-terminal domain-containing protein [Variovorax guangxiensis]MDR6853894.1 filamentous hemagglutinin family protein [Variovorax guangxiensis]
MNSQPKPRRAERTRPAHFPLRPVALALACMSVAAPALAQLPTWNNFVVRGGTVAVGSGPGNLPITAAGVPSAAGTILPITQGTARAIIDWQGFSIGPGNAVNITQQAGPRSVLLNRVTGNDLSTIAGSMTANGRVFLVNPNGVLFASGSAVNVGGLVASTLKMGTSDADFMGGSERLVFQQEGNVLRTVENRGSITAVGGGTVALISGSAGNSGSMVAQGGTAALVSADTVTVDFAGDGLTTFKVSPGLFGSVSNNGLVQADGGRVVLMTTGGSEVGQGVVNNRGVLRADTLSSRNGEIVLDSGSSAGGVTINGGLLSARGNESGLQGGTIDVTGRTILLQPYVPPVAAAVVPLPNDSGIVDASGAAGGGRIRLHATAVGGNPQTGAIAVAAGSRISADATIAGNGGDIRLLGERTLRAYGTITARGGPAGGNGGFIETSGGYAVPAGDNNGGIDLAGLSTDASAPNGTAGQWMIDPFDVTIVNGDASGTLTGNPFVPVAASTIQDGDINAALNGGTSVRITTGDPGVGSAFLGDIVMDDVQIEYTGNKGPLTLQLDAHRSVRGNTASVIASVGDPLNVIFNADVNGAGAAVGGGQVSYSGAIYSNGGNVVMNGAWANASNGMCSICLTTALIDTRTGNQQLTPGVPGAYTGGSDAGLGGAVQLRGISTLGDTFQTSFGAVYVQNSIISTATGDISIFGSHSTGSGVRLENFQSVGTFSTTSGNISVTGIGTFNNNVAGAPGHGVEINSETLRTVSGNITVTGRRLAGGPVAGSGVLLQDGALLQTTGGGDIFVTGQYDGTGAGVNIAPPASTTSGPGGQIDGSRNVVLRAVNDGSTDALVIGDTVHAGNALDLRPGGVDLAGNALDRTDLPITIGSTVNTGFAVSAAELGLITTPTLVAGSDTHAADITVVGPLALASALTLHNGAGGNIRLAAPVSTPQLGLLSAGDITQAAGTAITAGALLARSSGGNVLLTQPGNNVAVVGGSAAGRFEYTDADALALSTPAVTSFNAATNLAQTVSGTTVSADRVLVRTLSGDLSLGTNVTSTTSTDLVAAARFQNLGAYTIAGAPWRVWADTWVGETRGGLFGSGLLPNLYHCAYLGLCTVTVTPADNHFIYAQQPAAIVLVNSAARPGGFPNPLFTYSITGLILGDTGAGFAGTLSSPATSFSVRGTYPINGSFSSAEGYAVTVVPGVLTVGGLVELIKPDLVRDNPSTWLYDRNIGPTPICLATGPLEGDRAAQGGDVLAREWSRVRSRPNLTNCIDTERRNGCGDF